MPQHLTANHVDGFLGDVARAVGHTFDPLQQTDKRERMIDSIIRFCKL